MTTKEVFQKVSEYFDKRHLGICSLGRTAEECYTHLPYNQILFLDCLGSVVDTSVGIAMGCPCAWVDVFETDGSFLSNMASIHSIAGQYEKLSCFTLFVFDNQMLESGGRKRSRVRGLDWASMFAAWNLSVTIINNGEELEEFLLDRSTLSTPQIVILDIDNTDEPNNCTKDVDGKESKYLFKRYIQDTYKKGIVRPCVKN